MVKIHGMSWLVSRGAATGRTVLALAAVLMLCACDTMVHVDATAVVPTRYSRVLITVEEIWFNESALAIPADTTWQKFELGDEISLDLVDLTGGAIARIASDLKVPVGTYRQIRVLLASRDEDLHDSAVEAGARYNNEVTWINEDGDEETLPLEVLSVDQGIGVVIELEVEETLTEGAVVQLLFDAANDLTPFRYSDQTGFLLNPALTSFEPEEVGTIRGRLDLSRVDFPSTGESGIEVTAQRLDETLNRRVIVGRASVSRNGSFVLYPLPLDEEEDTTEYDLVIHGPRIESIVLRDVPVVVAPPDSSTQLALGNITPEPTTSFEADVRPAEPVLQRGGRIGFYQTLPGDDVPYLIAVNSVDPVSGRLAQPLALSRASSISYATYSNNFTLRSGTPEEGAARYAVAALSSLYEDGALSETLLRPASQASDTALFSVPAVGIPAGAVAGTISTNLTVDRPGRYDRGVLLIAREGAVVTTVPLDEILLQSPANAFVDVGQIPAGTSAASFDPGLYYIEAWTWDSDDPEDTFTRHPGAEAIDLRTAATALGTLAIR
jgi:hypothetical protein